MERQETIDRLLTYRDLAWTNLRLTSGAILDRERENHPELPENALEVLVHTNYRVSALRGKVDAIDFALDLLRDVEQPDAAELTVIQGGIGRDTRPFAGNAA